jgi:glycosyltransferase involved in cell wall biosynthesis
MGKALQEHVGDVIFIGPMKPVILYVLKVFNKISKKLFHRHIDVMHSIMLSKKFASIERRKLAKVNPDFIFAPAASVEIAFLETDVPIIFSSDATLTLVLEYYPEYSNWWPRLRANSQKVEAEAFRRANVLLFSSSWAARSAVRDYQIDEKRARAVPYGANIEAAPPREQILQKKKGDVCRLLFLGVSWSRKGGSLAFAALQELTALGVNAELVVCGCVPPEGVTHPKMKVIPFLNKDNPAEYQVYQKLMSECNFLFVPTRAESFGIVFCEAGAYGLPVISTRTGGVPDIVRDGENGYLLSLEADGKEYAAIIHQIFSDDERYYKLVRSSRDSYDERLSWAAWASKVNEAIKDLKRD